MKEVKKIIVFVLCATMIFSAAGCGKKTDQNNLAKATFTVDPETASWKLDKSKADLTWYINFDWFAQTWGKDVATKYITEDTNVNVTYSSGADDKLNTMLASGDLPDIITIDGANSIVKDAAKFALPLDTLSELYDPYFIKHAAKPETVKYFTKKDGHIYGYPNFSTTKDDYKSGNVYGNQAFFVREDIYEKIGKPDMTTQKGFLAALKAVKDLGLKDDLGKNIIPLGAKDFGDNNSIFFEKTLGDFLGVPVLTEDKKYYDRYTDPDVMKWIKTFSQARRDGYTDPDMLTMSVDDKNTRLSNGRYFAYFCPDVIGDTDSISFWENDHPDQSYIAIDGPSSTMERKIALTSDSIEGWTLTFVSKSCKNPQKAMELITYLTSQEGDLVMNFGRLGETYTMVDNKPVMNADLLKLKQTDPGKFEKEVGLTTHLWLEDSVRLSGYMGIAQFPAALQQAKEWTKDKIVPKFEIAQLDIDLSKESTRNVKKIDQKWSQTLSDMLNAKTDEEVDKAMEDFKQYRIDNGYKKIVEERNQKIAENIEKLK